MSQSAKRDFGGSCEMRTQRLDQCPQSSLGVSLSHESDRISKLRKGCQVPLGNFIGIKAGYLMG